MELRVLIHAPRGRDAAVVKGVLESHHWIEVCDEPAQLAACLDEGAGAAILTEEALSAGDGAPLWVMSSQAYRHFSPADRALLSSHGEILHTELSAFEKLGGGSARCLIAELF